MRWWHSHIRAGPSRRTPAYAEVKAWCEANEDESGLQSGEHGDAFMVVWLRNELPGCSDEEVELPDDMDASGLTDALRLQYVRERLAGIFAGTASDAEDFPLACTIWIRASNGKTA